MQNLGYMVFDFHRDHTYSSEADRKNSGLITRDRMANAFASGPNGETVRAWLWKRLGFVKAEAVMFEMRLCGETGPFISVTDMEGFTQFEHLLKLKSTIQLHEAGYVEVQMQKDRAVKNMLEKGGADYSLCGSTVSPPLTVCMAPLQCREHGLTPPQRGPRRRETHDGSQRRAGKA